MTEELNNLNTDLKELFMNQKFEEIVDQLNDQSEANIHELTYANYDVIKKYCELEKYDLIFTHIKFVAYTCFCCEYAFQRGVIDATTFDDMMKLFNGIYAKLQEASQGAQ